jgi:hypothetical protein
MADGGTIGLAPNTYLTLATWNAMYFLPYVDAKYEAVHGPNLWHNAFVAVLRTADGTAEPTKTADAMPPLFAGSTTPAASATPIAPAGSTDVLHGPADAVYPDADVLDAVRDAIGLHGLDQDTRLGLEPAASITIGRRLDVASLSPAVPAYRLAEVKIAGRVVAIAMLIRTGSGIQFAGLQRAYAGNAMRAAAEVRTVFAGAGFAPQQLALAWRPSPDSFEPFSPYWIATDLNGARRYLTPAGAVLTSLPEPDAR